MNIQIVLGVIMMIPIAAFLGYFFFLVAQEWITFLTDWEEDPSKTMVGIISICTMIGIILLSFS